MPKLLTKFKGRVQNILGRMERYQEAVTFAEADQTNHAQQLLREKEPQKSPGKLLVVGRESVFNQEVIDYALDMAQRFSYEILALNTAPLNCETFNLLPTERSKVCREFRTLAEKNISHFRLEAVNREIPFKHVIKFSEKDQALVEINREFGDIEFVISDAEEDRPVERASQGKRPRREIYVYSMV
jgi:hypothetical protein